MSYRLCESCKSAAYQKEAIPCPERKPGCAVFHFKLRCPVCGDEPMARRQAARAVEAERTLAWRWPMVDSTTTSPDFSRCQGEYRVFAPAPGWYRCENTPVVLARSPHPPHGEVAMCESCQQKCAQYVPGVVFRPIEAPWTTPRTEYQGTARLYLVEDEERHWYVAKDAGQALAEHIKLMEPEGSEFLIKCVEPDYVLTVTEVDGVSAPEKDLPATFLSTPGDPERLPTTSTTAAEWAALYEHVMPRQVSSTVY